MEENIKGVRMPSDFAEPINDQFKNPLLKVLITPNKTPEDNKEEHELKTTLDKQKRTELVAEMYKRGVSYKEMADELGLGSPSSVSMYVTEALEQGLIEELRGQPFKGQSKKDKDGRKPVNVDCTPDIVDIDSFASLHSRLKQQTEIVEKHKMLAGAAVDLFGEESADILPHIWERMNRQLGA